jgi:high-affinity nickel-transport protein
MFGVVGLLHLLGWGLFLANADHLGPAYAGAGGLAYSFGLRHAFDADHISAIDDTTRFLMQRDDRPMGVGFFFSLGHSTIVFALAIGAAVAADSVRRLMPGFEHVGGIIGATVSATFLLAIAFADLLILRGILSVWRAAKTGRYQPAELDELMGQRGFMNRVMGPRWRRRFSKSWQMYPLGVLFGLGFDTASEVGLLALTTAAATGGAAGAPASGGSVGAVLALPLLFTAGMCLMDTTDGVMMTRAYGWAAANPIRKIYYNLATVGLGVFIAATVGLVQVLQLLSDQAGFRGGIWDVVGGLDFQLLGYLIVAAFVVCWVGSMVLYRVRHIEERYGIPAAAEA